MRHIRWIVVFFLLFWSNQSIAQQELNCIVSISAPTFQETEREMFNSLQTELHNFVNQRNWTDYQFLPRERIDANISITVNERLGPDEFRATITVQSRRPVYRSAYHSTLFNHQDRDFFFRFSPGQNIEFVENAFTSNLTAVIAYYVYIILGFDFDSFTPFGGTPYFEMARSIVNLAQNTPERGWKSFESQRNRYWLVENLFNPSYRGIREFMYTYHRLGFDNMVDNMETARAEVVTALEMLQRAHRERPGSFLMQLLMTAKGDEMVNLFTQAPAMDRNKAIAILTEIDPANSARYRRMSDEGR